MNSKLSRTLLDKPYLVWSALFIIAPLIMVLYYALTDSSGAFTLRYIEAIPDYTSTILLSIIYGVLATAICLLLGYPFAYFISKSKASVQGTMVLLVMLPMWMNFLIRTYSLMTILGDSGIINTILNAVGIDSLKLINTGGAVLLGMVYNFLPFMVLPIYNVLIKIDDNVIHAAKDLGANSVQTFFKIIFPLSIPGVISGITMVFIPSLTTFVISNLLGGGKIYLIGNIIEQEFTTAYNWHLGSGLSMVLMVFILLNMILTFKFDKGGGGAVL